MVKLPYALYLVVFKLYILMLAKIRLLFKHNLYVNTFAKVEHDSLLC